MTKKNQGLLWSYEHATARTIWEAYARPSSRKVDAYTRDCLGQLRDLDGYDGRITGASSHFFSYAFRYMKDGVERLRYITYANNYDFAIEEA